MRKHLPSILLGAIGAAFLTAAGLAIASRNSAGTYSRTATYVSGTTISSATVNAEMADFATEMTDSLNRSGKGGMLQPLRGIDGTKAAPAFSWTSESGLGWYRNASHDLRLAINGNDVGFWGTSGMGIGGAPTNMLDLTVSGSASTTLGTWYEGSLADGNSLQLNMGKAVTNGFTGLLVYTKNATAANSTFCLGVSGGGASTLCVDGNNKVLVSGSTGFSTGIPGDGSGFKHKRFGASCSTLAVAGNTCTSTLTWVTAFADANYTVTCTGQGPAGVPLLTLNTHVAASATINVTASTAVIASFTEVDCIAVHD